MMEGKRSTRRRGTPIPVAPPRVPTPMPPYVDKGGTTSHAVSERCTPSYKPLDNNFRTLQDVEEIQAIKMITPRMDREGYFNYVAATAKKKKISLMQSKLPKLSHELKASGAVEVRGGKSFQRGDTNTTDTANNSCARNAVVDGRVSMSHRYVSRGPRGSDPWIDHVNNRSNKDYYDKSNKVTNNVTLNRSANDCDRQKFNQNKFDEYQCADRYKINHNNLPRDDSERYKNNQNNARVSCHRQNSIEYMKGAQNNGNQAALECFSPKYHHIRPQPRGRESPAGQAIKYGQVIKGSEQSLYKNVDRNQSALVGGSVRKIVHSEVKQVVLQAPQVGFYSESQFSYRVNGVPGNAAQASAAAAFFARSVILLY